MMMRAGGCVPGVDLMMRRFAAVIASRRAFHGGSGIRSDGDVDARRAGLASLA